MTVLQVVMPYALGRVFAESIVPNNSKVTLIHIYICVYVCMYICVCVCVCVCVLHNMKRVRLIR